MLFTTYSVLLMISASPFWFYSTSPPPSTQSITRSILNFTTFLVLQWFTSYFVDCPQRIVLDKLSSHPRRLSCGVPQGFVLGPVLFSLYIFPLEDVITGHCLNAMMYADDSQLYIIARRSHRAVGIKVSYALYPRYHVL